MFNFKNVDWKKVGMDTIKFTAGFAAGAATDHVVTSLFHHRDEDEDDVFVTDLPAIDDGEDTKPDPDED